jgi:peptidoglycan/xylan/chitin deacetylase (PgdA/CDA1 family)
MTRQAAASRRAKDAIRKIGAEMYGLSGLYRVRHRGRAVILAYHRVLRAKDLDESFIQPGMYVLEDVFEKQMRFLKDAFEIVPLADLLARWRTGTWDRRARYCAITFDDGWLDNYLHAYPILRRYGIPATIFLPTAFIGTQARFWWDELTWLLRRCWSTRQGGQRSEDLSRLLGRYAWLAQLDGESTGERLDWIVEKFKDVPEQEICDWVEATRCALDLKAPEQRALVNWQEVAEMSGCGISFGSHSSTHRILTRLSREEIRKELRDSFDSLSQQPIRSIPVFCYPNGDYNRDVVEEVQQAGYQAAVSGRFGLERGVPDDVWGLKRIGVHNDVSRTPALFALRVSGLSWA